MELINKYIKIDLKNFNFYTILSLICLIAGILFWIAWGIRFGVWYDIGIYSITIVLVLGGLIGTVLSLMDKEED